MSKEKQIEEIAGCVLGGSAKERLEVAELIYSKGYRKQPEGEWLKSTPFSQEYCNQCGLTPKTLFGILPPFCPNCGAKMKT